MKPIARRYTIPQSGSFHERAAEILRDMITEGELVVGAKMNEVELCSLLGISRTPLREAIKVLAGEGLVKLTPNRGATVTEPDVGQIDATIEAVALIEAAAGRLACAKASERTLKAIAALHAQMIDFLAKGEAVKYFRTNQRFHDAIVEATGNPVLIDTHSRLNAHLKRIRYQRMHDISKRAKLGFTEDHGRIVDGLMKRDAAAVEAAILTHLRHVGAMVNGSATPAD